ncbi:InlB B-repeat-containing protein [Bifidobacterium longum]|uniref:InlB B-repeat-containing protein n=3 Tax=Bifidobacterium longum TaxID=216816 RepID=UPI000A51B23A|nr:InlB B-repeat-containing protein [Bifidobacterium longum]
MHAWLKRAVAGLLSAVTLLGGGLLTAGTANADEIRMPDIGKTITSLTASAATTYPRELVNGGFDYLPAGGWNVISPKLNTSRGKFTSVDPVNGQYIRNAHVTDGNVAWVKWDGFDASKFGWISDQKGGKPQGFVTDHANSVELQRDNDTDNTYAEIVGSEIGKSIYQKIDTQNSTDAVYTVRFDHAALSSEHADGMQALVNGKPVTMTRIGGNKAGDKTGWTGTDIVTHATNTDHYRHDGQWATYEGKVTIPANTPVSTFMFKSLNEAKPDMGNLIDNLTFKIAYRLSYDSNGGTKAKASQISSMTEGKASETDGKVKTVADDAAGRTVLECKRSGEGATGPYADKFCWIDWSNLPLDSSGKPTPVRINVPGGHIDADATVAHTDNAALTAKDFTGNKWSRLIPAYRLTGNTALAFTHIQGNSADPLASVMFSNITPVANQTATSVNVLKDFQLAFGDAETMSGYVVNDKKIYEQTDIESDKTLDKLGMIGDNNPNQSYSEANTGYGTTHVTLAGGPAGAHALTDEADSKGAAVIGATHPTRFKVSFKQVNHPADDSWSAIAIGVYMPYLTAHPLAYDKNGRDATGSVPSNENAGAVKQAKSKTSGSVRLAADDDVAEYAANGLPDHLVNGDFEYPVKSDMPVNDRNFWYISQNDGSYFAKGLGKRYKLPEGFDKAKFAWHSTQTGDTHYPDLERADDVQVDYTADGTNHYSEISAAQSGATIYQDVATVPGVMYKWSLKHASLHSSHLDKMSVIIGKPGKETAQEATRTTANGHGDKLGKVGTVISTKVSNPEMPDGNKIPEGAHTGQWETYTGTYIATGTVTRFAFRSVEGYSAWDGNLLDDISFSKAYKLTYDKNASDATGKVPSNQRGKENAVEPAESKTTGNVKTVADNTSNLPDHLVNGTFDYRGNEIINENQRVYGSHDTTYLAIISAKTGIIGNPLHSKLDNWNSGKFGWRSNDDTAGADTVEVQRRNHTPYPTNAGNVWGEIAAAKRGKYIYQDIATTPGVVYKWSLKHASRNADQDDSMQVMIGEPGAEAVQEATRTTSNGTDKVGEKSTTITTHGTAQDGKWETYTGDYLATSTTTRFTFRSVRDSNGQGLDFTAEGNCVDDLSFDKAYRLSYDKNASDATGKVPSNQRGKENTVQPAKSKTTGSVGLAADKTASGLTVHDLKKNDKGKVPSSSKADSTQPAAFKAPDAKVETIASRAAGDEMAVNGGFDTPKWTIAKEGQGLPWVYVTPNKGMIRSYAQAMAGQTGVKAGGLTAATFAWQDVDATGGIQNFELHREKDGNTAADVHAGRTVAQTVNTTPGASYTFSIRHSGRSKGNAGGVTLLTGPDKDHLTPVKLTRTTVSKTGQKYGDKTGDVGTVAYTHSDSMDATEGSHEPWDHSNDWESYEGTVIIPAGQSRTMIAYRGVAKDGTLTASANDSIIDDLSFRLAYKLSYDANGGAKKSTSQIKASTDGKVKTIAGKTDSLPTELVNGSFDYPAGLIAGVSTKYPWDDWTVVDPINGRYARHIGIDKDPWAPIPGWDASKFAWKSTQTKGTDWQQIAQGVELQKDSKTGNQYAELVAGQAGTAIYQDIATIPGVSYRWELKHASLDRTHLDGMSVMIGEPGKESAQDATRTTVNGNGDQPGDVGKVISTKVRNKAELGGSSNHSSRNHDGQWETYTGTYIATGTVTRFTFKSVSSSNNVNGNILDDLSFTKAYRLGYDANGGAKTNASKISASSNGTVRLAATRTSVPSHALEDTDVPADYRSFTFDTTRTRLADARFDGNWTTTRDEAGGSIHWPTRLGASATLPNTGTWTDPDGVEHRINATIALKQWNGGNIGQLNRFDGNGKIVGDGLFWINVVYDNTKVPASVRKALGGIDTSKRVGCQWTVSFTYEDGTPVPSTFKGVTGFNDLDGFDARPDLKFEGVQLLSGFDGAYRTRDAELASYGTNGYAGIKHDAGDESNLNGAQQVRHRLAATWTGPTFTYSYDLENPTERTDGVRMTFGMPVTRTQVLTYKANGGTGQVPSRTEAGKTETAASRMNGTVRLAADRDTEPESGTTTDDRKVLTDTIARQDDGTSQRTITRSDGSVQVQTIADTGAVSGCQVYYPAGAKITLATAKADSDCWDSSQISKTNRTFYGWSANTDANDKDVPIADTMDRATLDANAETQITMPARAKTVYALWAINPTLTYNVNAPATTKAPDAPASMTVPYNTAADDKSGWTVGDTGKITGYSFDGWYTSPTGGDKYDWSTKLTNDVTMYAHWTANGYTVKYDAGGGKGTMGDQKFTFDVPQNLSPNAFTRDGYTFTGWKRADTGDSYTDGQQVSNLTSTPNGIVTMIAQWTPNPASINYDPNPPTGRTPGGQGTANWTGHTGDTQAIGANGWTVDGYTFIGWNTSADGKGTAYAPGTTWTANGTLTLYAQWTPGQAGLTYDGNGATGGKTDPQPGKTDEKINVRDNGFTRDGYMFVTWNTQADCKGKAVDPGDEWTLQGSGTLYACWAGNAQTLTYHGNGATGGNTAAQSGKTGDELTTNANGFTRDGYTFVRWDTAKDGSGTAYGEGKNGVSQYVMKPAGNDLYAIWKANPATIQYRNDWPNTTGSTPDTTGNTGDTVTISQNSFDRPGYTFTGWSTSKRGDPSLQPGDKHTLEPRTTTVWAQWKADPAHLVYNSNIGTVGSETKTVDGVVDQTVKTITNPFDRPGYTFSGWNTQADGKGKAYATGADYVLTANDKSTPKNTSVLYAQWKINGASLKFNPNGGIGHVDDVTGDAFSTVTIPGDAKEPKITRPGYRFVGWSTEKNPPAGSTFLQPGEGKVTLPAEGSTTVYAQWEPSLTTLPFTGGQAQVPTIWLYAGFALMLIALGVMMPMLRMRMAATKRTGKHMPITGGKHAK